MAQSDNRVVVPNTVGATFRSNINKGLEGLASTFSGDNAPTAALIGLASIPEGFLWVDTAGAASILKVYNGTNFVAVDTDTTANETITLSGDATGSGTTAITVTVTDDSHSHSNSTVTSLAASKLTGDLPAISGANLTNLPAGGNTITIGQGTTTFSYGSPSGFRVDTVTLNARSFFPRVESNNFGTDGNPGGQPNITGRTIGGGSTIPGGVGSNYTIPFNVSLLFRTDHGRGGATRVSWEYLTFS